MLSVNKHEIIGKLGRDPEQCQFPNGGSVVSFSMATSESYRDKSGDRQEITTWHNVSCFNEGLSKVIMKHWTKGTNARVLGEIKKRKYKDRDGNDRVSVETVLSKYGGEITLLDSRNDSGKGNQSGNRNNASQGGYGGQDGAKQDFDLDDEIPF